MIRNLQLTFLLLLAAFAIYGQNIARTIEYRPAPGQHINLEQTGTPQAAQNLAENERSLVSLGAYGGYIILKFDEVCENDPDNPYGVDFTIFGNAFSGSSEPGVVWVMKDENQNGKPDDAWYEIAGSHHFHSKTVRNYTVTYFKTDSGAVRWEDEKGKFGFIKANNYNTQQYYPTERYFPEYPRDSVVFTGMKLEATVNSTNSVQLSMPALDFGYADNHPKRQGVDLTKPDNPYTRETEGAGGDPIDISWATDKQGNYVDLNEIHFVKIATGYLADLGRLGEASTDVSYVVDILPDTAVSGNENLLVVYHPPSKIILGNTVFLEANYFKAGRRTETDVEFSSANFEIIKVGSNGEMIAQKTGTAEVVAATGQESKSFSIDVIVPDSVAIQADLSALYPGDTVLIGAQVFDNLGDFLDIETIITSSDSSTGTIIQLNNDYYFVAKAPGENSISVKVKGFELQEKIMFRVLSENDKIRVYFAAKTENENLFPRQWMEVGLADINSFVENRQQDYSDLHRLTLAHAILAGLQNANVNFAFRDDESSEGQLYVYSVENDGLFSYGWGGTTEPLAFARAWIARLNGSNYLNNFDVIEISSGDTIALYHISDITSPWYLSRLTSDKDSANAGETVELLTEQTTCTFENGAISETPFMPLENREIAATESYFTDENGKAEITLHFNSPWIFYSGNDAVLIHQRISTGAFVKKIPEVKVYPNPANEYLYVEGVNISGSVISILNSTAKTVLQNNAQTDRVSFNTGCLKAGLYFLKTENEKGVTITKFIKQ